MQPAGYQSCPNYCYRPCSDYQRSLFFSVNRYLSGAAIYTFGSGVPDPLIKMLDVTFSLMGQKVDFQILLFCTLLGALVYVLNMSGGTKKYGEIARRKIKNRETSVLATCGLSFFIFIDDYFNCLTVGTVMKPLTDSYRVSREKLAYIIDSTAAPMCIIAPVSSWLPP